MNPEVPKSQQALASSAQRLMMKHPWRDITVSMLCEEAQVSRTTFYTHFATTADLLEEIFSMTEHQLTAQSVEGRGLTEHGSFAFLPGLIRHLREKKMAFQRQKNNETGMLISNRLRLMIANMMEIEAKNTYFAKSLSGKNVTFLSGAVSAIVRRWAEENHRESDQELVSVLDKYITWFLDTLNR
ncbi:MAG: hypothetical protein Pars2KO_31990 [Parasphingorhabdus sp.]